MAGKEEHTTNNPYCDRPIDGCWCHLDADYHQRITSPLELSVTAQQALDAIKRFNSDELEEEGAYVW